MEIPYKNDFLGPGNIPPALGVVIASAGAQQLVDTKGVSAAPPTVYGGFARRDTPVGVVLGEYGAEVLLGLGRIVALHHRSSTAYHICLHIRDLFF